MAKLSELKALLATARKTAPESSKPTPPPAAAAPKLARHKPADAEVDLRQVFADVEPLRSHNRAPVVRARPASVPAKRLADEADALAMSKHGVEPSPANWEVGTQRDARDPHGVRLPGLRLRLNATGDSIGRTTQLGFLA